MYDFVIIGGGIIGMSTAMQLIDVYADARIAGGREHIRMRASRCWKKSPRQPATRPGITAA
ncbi:hypothetical protein LTSEGIV_3761 [Salmonella enterica subsp. enterica serovar Give str. S5-487]|nr:hypothetical protein LTSEGIV_3761 [Salmonella enterica subsp. enterica serovar Give str. S5-487]